MDDQEIRRLQEEEQTYWWHVSRREVLHSVLARHAEFISASLHCHPGPTGRRPSSDSGSRPGFRVPSIRGAGKPGMTIVKILDVGCGTGENFCWLSKFGEVIGVDSSETAVMFANSAANHMSPELTEESRFNPRAESRPGRTESRGYIISKAVLGRAEDLPVETGEVDLVTAFDVLEHLSDENRVIEEWGRVLRSGGLLFISVPAYQSLFGPHDRALGHFRRYNLPPLIKLLQTNGFSIIFSSYFFCLTFPLFWLQRILVKKSSQTSVQYVAVPKWINNFLIGAGKLESWWLSFAKFPFGSSIVVLAQKK